MPKIKVNKIELNYEEYGKGEVLLFLHGLGSTKADWDAQVPFFSKKYRVVVVDLRGHGKTSIPSKDYGVRFMTEDIKQLLDVLKIEKTSVVGFSMGGAVAFQLAYDSPEKIKNLVIVNSGPDFNNMGKIGEDLLNNRTEFLKTKGLSALAKEIAYNMFPEDAQVDMRSQFEERCKENDYDAYYNSFVTLMNWGLGDKLKEIKTRTLIVASDMDYTPVSFKEEYVKRMPNAELSVIKNSRHGTVIDQSKEFNKVLENFLNYE